MPGISVSQSGAPGQITSVFTRGLNSDQSQVLIDGIPINQGLAGAFDFSDLTGDNIGRIEIERGPQSTLYGPRAAAGTIQLFTRRGDDLDPAHPFSFDASSEGGNFGTFRERLALAGVIGLPVPATPDNPGDGKDGKNFVSNGPAVAANGPGIFDYSLGVSRLDTDNERPNNEYRNTAVVANVGFAPRALTLDTFGGTAPRFGVLVLYSYSDASSPDTIFDPAPLDNLLTERQLYAPNIDWQLTKWWHHRLVLEYDKERQVDNPNEADPFTGSDARHLLPLPARLPERHRLHPLADADHRRVLRERPGQPAAPVHLAGVRTGGDVPQGFHGRTRRSSARSR